MRIFQPMERKKSFAQDVRKMKLVINIKDEETLRRIQTKIWRICQQNNCQVRLQQLPNESKRLNPYQGINLDED